MSTRRRSPFGELLRRHRRQRSMTQLQLSIATIDPAMKGGRALISERAILDLERKFNDPAQWVVPRPRTVSALAAVFGLVPGTDEHREFMLAARATDTQPPPETPGPNRAVAIPIDEPIFAPRRTFVAEGRTEHLARLENAIARAANGSPGVVLVSANPGTGKTWLIEEACRRALQQYPTLVTLWGNCSGRLGEPDPLQPFRIILGTMLGDIQPASPQQLVTSHNVSRIVRRVPIATQGLFEEGRGLVDRLIPQGALRNHHLAKLPDSPARQWLMMRSQEDAVDGDLTINPNEQVYRLLAHYADAGPTILVLEDLHWADTGTAALLFHILRRLHGQHLPMLVIGSYRPADLGPPLPGEQHPLPPLLHEVSLLFENPLLDLSTAVGGEAGRAFVRGMAEHAWWEFDEATIDLIFERSEGLPLFVNSIMRLREQRGSNSALTDPVTGVPSDLNDLFAEQFDSLSPELQQILKYASVQGTGFSAEILMQALDLPRATAIRMLDRQLVQQYRQLLPGGVSLIGSEMVHEYQFAHALLRDYVYYHRMSDEERATLHTATAEAMIALYGGEHHSGTATIAFHLDQAGNRERAAAAYLRAGAFALDVSSFELAYRLYRRIIELDLGEGDPYSHAHALVGIGACARALDRREEAIASLEQAIAFARRQHLPRAEANAIAGLGMLDYDAGRMRQGSDRLRQAIALNIEAGDLDEACRSLARLSHNLHGMGAYDEAAAVANRSIELATSIGNDVMLVAARIAYANCLLDTGLYDQAIAIYEQCIVMSEEHADTYRINFCLINMAVCHFAKGEWASAERAILQMMEPGRSVVPRFVAAGDFTLGIAYEGMGRWADAKLHFERSRMARQSNGQDGLLIDSLAGLLRVALHDGELADVRALVEEITRRIADHGLDGIELVGRLTLTLIDGWRMLGDEAAADRTLREGTEFIMTRANRFEDPAHRETYLTNVPAHRRLLALHRGTVS